MSSLPLAGDATLAALQDAALVKAARRDLSAFAALYWRYVKPVYGYLYSRLRDVADAEDLTSQVFAEALQGLAAYRERQRFSAWLFAIARRRAVDYHRRKRNALPLSEEIDGAGRSADPLSHVMQAEAAAHLAALVGALSGEEQELLRLHFAADLSYGEIGAVVGRSEAAIKMAMHRLLRRLEDEWEGRDG